MSNPILFLTGLLASSALTLFAAEKNETSEEANTETVTVTGRRIQQQTEATEATQKLLDMPGNE